MTAPSRWTSCRFAPHVRCDVGGPTCAVAAVASKVRARADSRVLITVSSLVFELNAPSAIRADALLDLPVDASVLPLHLLEGDGIVGRELVPWLRHRLALEDSFRRDHDLAVAQHWPGIPILGQSRRGGRQHTECGEKYDALH